MTYSTSDHVDTRLMISALVPMMFRHSLTATTTIRTEMVLVRVFLSLSFSAGVFLVPANFVKNGMTASQTTTVMTIQRTNVTSAVNQGLLKGSDRVLGNIPKNWLKEPSEVYTELMSRVAGTVMWNTFPSDGDIPRSVNARSTVPV